MNGAISLPIQLDDSAIRDELANLRLQAFTLVSVVNTAGVQLTDLKSLVVTLSSSVAGLSGDVHEDVSVIREQLKQIQAELEVIRDIVPASKPTFVLSLSVKNKETA